MTDRSFLTGGGEMGERTRAMDWSRTPVGPIEGWPQSLKTAVSICLGSRHPIVIWWGETALTQFYNDAYISFLGKEKHPAFLGQPGHDCWREIWPIVGPMLDEVFRTGQATWSEDFLYVLHRNLPMEEGYFTFSYSPIRDDEGAIDGIFCACNETTSRVLAERRLRTLRDLGGIETEARTVQMTCESAARTLAENRNDIPFSLIYLLDDAGRLARLFARTAIDAGSAACPIQIDLARVYGEQTAWPVRQVMQKGKPKAIHNLTEKFGSLPGGPWPESSDTALILPIAVPGQSPITGFLVCGISPRLVLDTAYTNFLEFAAKQVGASIAGARASEEERKRAEALVEIDRAKTRFFSNVSHEFRTPLTLMLGPLEDALGSANLSGKVREELDAAHRNSLRLLKLVNSLLDFSRIEAGRARASYEAVDLATFTAELASNFRSACERASLRLVVDCPPLGEPIYVDREMWEKVVLNLLSNAFKFTFEGEIGVGLRRVNGQAVLCVRDTGVGVPPHELPRLFERFHRIEGQRSRTYEGSGIGLAVVQELVKLHGGAIRADSVAPHGTSFTVTIPSGRSHLPQDRIDAERELASTSVRAASFVEEALRWLPDLPDEMSRQRETETLPEPRGRAKIVLADDNADMRAYVRRLLGTHYDVQSVSDGQAAIEAIRERQPNLVLADVMMPRLDGFGLVRALRSDPVFNNIPVILLSARAGEEAEIEGLKTGADDYLIKPFSARELIARVEAHLKLARFRGQIAETLKDSEERFRAFVTASWDVVYRMSPDWGEMRSLQGKDFIADLENPSQNWLEKYIHPDDRAYVLAAIDKAIQAKGVFELEHRVIRTDGVVGWGHSRAIPVLDTRGDIVEWFGAVRDISDRKRAEENQQLLVRELNHRVKNTLANVQAIVQQTLRTAQDPTEFVARFSGRIQSLARVHSLLTDASWRGTDLRHLIRDQLLMGATDEARLAASGPSVYFDPQRAVHVALLLHELGTNSVKYGSLSTSNGRVTVSWKVVNEILNLEWTERGGPAVAAPRKRGFGTTLIERIADGSGGSAQMIFEPTGVTWKISLVLPSSDANLDASDSSNPELSQTTAARKSEMAGASSPLEGLRFLVIEDEPLIGLDLADMLERAGAIVGPPIGSEREALRIIERDHFDGALLDANLGGRSADRVAAALTRREVPFIFVTGYGKQDLPASSGQAPVLAKPVSARQLLDTLIGLTRKSEVTCARP